MVIRLPGTRCIEVHWLADGGWQWSPRVSPYPPHWLYWGRFAACVVREARRERPVGARGTRDTRAPLAVA